MATNSRFLNRPKIQFLILSFLLFLAIGIRLHNIATPPLDFSPIRQYQNAHIARGLYYEGNDSISEQNKVIAELNMQRMGLLLEPRIIENAAVLGYGIIGSEQLWIPRFISSIFWIIGGIFLFLTARMIFSPGVALFSAFIYLFLPYGILASRSFQPDPLMVMMMLFSIYMVMRYDENQTAANLIGAAVIASLAVLIKPYCVFIIFGGFFSLAVLRMGFWKASLNRNTITFGLLMILPTVVYYLLGFLMRGGFLGEHTKGSFLPHLLLNLPFWEGWFNMIVKVIGYTVILLSVTGLIKAGPGKPRALLLGLWIGYFVLGLSATYQIHTHDYYSMPLIPVTALSIAPLAATVIDRRSSLLSVRSKIIFMSLLLLIVSALGLGMKRADMKVFLSDHKSELKSAGMVLGVPPEFIKFMGDDFRERIRMAKEIGEHVGHNTNTLFLTPEFGRVLAYHGEFAGLPWPTSNSLYARRVRGERVPDIQRDFTPEHVRLLFQGKFIEYTPDYFIITAFNEFDKQPELKDYLNSNFPVLVQTDDYLIFDLREMSD